MIDDSRSKECALATRINMEAVGLVQAVLLAWAA
jgi:hypothetical protein